MTGGASVEGPQLHVLVPASELPRLDMTQTIGVVLSRWVFKSRASSARHTHVERLWFAKFLLWAYYLGHALAALVFVVPRGVGAPLAIVGCLLTLPGSLGSVALLQAQVARLVMTTYDFWFFSIVSTLTCVLLGRALNDARACVAIIFWWGSVHTTFVDANTRLICYFVIASLASTALAVFTFIAIEAGVVSDWSSFPLFTIYNRVVDGDNLILNGLVTLTILHLRNAYRRHTELVEQAKIGCKILRCINYRCRLTLRRVTAAVDLSGTGVMRYGAYYVPSQLRDELSNISYPVSQMMAVRTDEVFDATHTFLQVSLQPLEWSPALRIGFASLGAAGIALTIGSFATHPSDASVVLGVLGFACTLVFSVVWFGLYQRRLLRHVVLTFDFLFLSLQLSLGLGGVSMLFRWDTRAIPVASIWLWLHCLITLDALTLLMKRKIGFRKQHLACILLLFVASQVLIVCELVVLNRWQLRDLVIKLLDLGVEWRLVPFLFSRLNASFVWSWRLLTRVALGSEDDTIIVMGRLGYPHLPYTYDFKKPTNDATVGVVKMTHSQAPTQPGSAQVVPT
ncbi:hypothetical protein P43SY_011505 [Pythium insidiosum]|uniref:Transmembrane protein n=1 Tax=Pythium insidiosum TaxID=114742 RepID=A0AAD5Q3D9_PYTIN|nr:hypothetical protein P43SY_011505 [Pythium insidiosum]